MFIYLIHAIRFFRNCFSRHTTWLIFCLVILGFIGASEMVGVTSLCRFWALGENGYNMFVNFFHSTAWTVSGLVCSWSCFVLSQDKIVMIQGRAVLQGDHTYVPKDGRKIPGVVTLHQDSETQSKPSYFRGHCWGAIGALTGTLSAPFCTPLELRIHQGFTHIGKEIKNEKHKETLGTRIVKMALDFAMRHDLPSILTLDAFFSNRSCFQPGLFDLVFGTQTTHGNIDR